MLTHDQLAAAVRAEGVTLIEFNVAGYDSRKMCRCHSGDVKSTRHDLGGPLARAYDPKGDVTVHITAGDLGSRGLLQYCLDILVTNPNAPLAANFGVGPDGTAVLLSAGRTNHALYSSVAARTAQDSDNLSLTSYHDLRGSGDDPKIRNYGIENISSRALDTNPKQYATSVRICAAIARAYGRSGRNMIGHGEMAQDRSFADPGINMGQFRRDVMARVKDPTTQQEDDEMSWDTTFDNDQNAETKDQPAWTLLRDARIYAGQARELASAANARATEARDSAQATARQVAALSDKVSAFDQDALLAAVQSAVEAAVARVASSGVKANVTLEPTSSPDSAPKPYVDSP